MASPSATIGTHVEVPRVEDRAALGVGRVALDIWLLAERNLLKVWRNKRLIIFSTVQPIMQLILFAFVFGAIANLGDLGFSYKDFVVPAVIIQTVVFTGVQSGIGIADDLNTGMIDRFRSLPIARSSFLLGRTLSDTLRLVYQIIILVVAASAVGFRFHGGVLAAIAMPFVAVFFGMSLITFSEYMGLTVQDPETVQAAVFIPLLPLIFTSSAFAPISRLPGWMQPIARVNPVTSAIDTARGLALGDDNLYRVSQVHLSTAAIRFGIAVVAITVIFTVLAVRKYRKI
jgi:ABC-2 type transport system permease protein/oleandomycin transport system permease protein